MTKGRKRRVPAASVRDEEGIFADYLVSQSYTNTALKYGIPISSCFDIVKRIGGDALATHRNAMRADLATEIWGRIRNVSAVVTPENMGTAKASLGSEAARAANDLSRVAASLEPKDDTEANQPTVVNVYTGLGPSVDDKKEPA